ncbi:hypothetical protein CXB51_033259 [Gossypium anomalum]|uniref:Reverse transcriptase Ty1/copia-type domain-containing protein n=1 Tax=Gossypium anomalum TaxID=47600 RepID=A0A8J5YE29_9ROSI|nr:hypothetical protein CXB51_033259 [Gossypium anomalum]
MLTRSKAGIFKPKALCADNIDLEPSSVEEVLAHPAWRSAIQDEYDALIANSTWELCSLPPGRKAIGCKWLFKIKKNPDGTINHRKARLVAKGSSQVPGCDFTETFSQVVKPATIRVILSVAVTKGWPLRQVDVNNAFLNGDLVDDVYMQQPPGFVQHSSSGETLFYIVQIRCSLFVRSASDYTLYMLVYVDDIVITGSSSDGIDCFVQQLHNKFALKDMGDLHYFLGLEVSRSCSGSLLLCQRKYIRELLTRSSMSTAKSVHTPMVSSSMLSKDEGDYLTDPTEYRSLAGALHIKTYSSVFAWYSYGLLFRRSERLSLVGYADANWGLDFDDRWSTTGFCVYYGHTPISWCSKKQQVVSRSTAEAEYRSLAAATSDAAWLTSLLTELKLSSVDPPKVWCDNSSTVAVAANPVLHSKFKHVEIDLFFVREKVANRELVVGEVPACDQVADFLTKLFSVSFFT